MPRTRNSHRPKPGRVSWDTTPGSSRSAYSPLDIEAERARGLHLPAPVAHPAAIAPAATLQHATQNPCWNTVDPAAWFGLDPNQVMHVIHAALVACGAAEQHPTQLTPPPPLQLPPPLLNYDDLALPPTVASLSKWLPSPPPAEVPPPVEVSPPLPPAFDPAAPCWPLPTEEDLQQLSRLYKAYKAPPPGFPALAQPPLQPLQLLSQLYNHQACQTYHHLQGQQAGVATSNVQQDVPPQHYPVAAYPLPQHHQHHQHHHPDHTYHQHHHQHAPRGEAYHQQQQQQQQQQQLERQYHQHQAQQQQQHQQRLEEEQQRRSYLQQQQQQAAHFHAQRQAQHYVQQKTPQAAAMYNQHQHQHYNAAAAVATASYQQHAPPPYQQPAVMPPPAAAAASPPPPFSYREAAGPHHQRHGAQLYRNRHGQ